MIKYLRLPFNFDAMKLQEELLLLGNEDWRLHFQKLHYEGDWSAIPLRSVDGDAKNIFVPHHDNPAFKDTILLDKSPYFKLVLASFHCPLKTVRLMKLNAGAVIKEHNDAELNYENGEARFHVPVITHPDVEFYLDNERITMNEGECWYMNFNLPHRITNNSSVDRIHLVIDATVNDWLQGIFSQDDLQKKEVADQGEDEKTRRQMIKLFREMNTEKSNQLADDLERTLL
jgi:quercetin dioxygenase-like cupin family protein